MDLQPNITDVLSDAWNEANKLQIEFCGTISVKGGEQYINMSTEARNPRNQCVLSLKDINSLDTIATFHTHPHVTNPNYDVAIYDNSMATIIDISPPSPSDIIQTIQISLPLYIICRMGIWYIKYIPQITITEQLDDIQWASVRNYVSLVNAMCNVFTTQYGADIGIEFYIDALTQFPSQVILNTDFYEFTHNGCAISVRDVTNLLNAPNEKYNLRDILESIFEPLGEFIGRLLCNVDFYKTREL